MAKTLPSSSWLSTSSQVIIANFGFDPNVSHVSLRKQRWNINTIQKYIMLRMERTKSWSLERIWRKWALLFEMITRRTRVFRLRYRMASLTRVSTSIIDTGIFTMEVGFKQRNQPGIFSTIPWSCATNVNNGSSPESSITNLIFPSVQDVSRFGYTFARVLVS